MTTQPEARLFRLSPDEAALPRPAGAGSGAAEAGTPAATAAAAADSGAAATPPRKRRRAEAEAPPAPEAAGQGETAVQGETAPRVRIEVRKRPLAPADAADPAGPADPAEPAADPAADAAAPAPAGGRRAAADLAGRDHASLLAPDEDDDGFAGISLPGSTSAARAAAAAAAAPPEGPLDDAAALAAEVEAVRAERLTPRQLRVANRLAIAQGVNAASDEEAVALLRRAGIDPLHRSALTRVVAEEGQRASIAPSSRAPSIIDRVTDDLRTRRAVPIDEPPGRARDRATPNLPSREALTEERRAAEIFRIQRDIARRRRVRMFMLFARLAAFVALPTILAGWYYFTQATPLYATESAFQIQKAESSSSGSLGSLFGGTQLATNPDSVAVQSYLGSRDAMLRLDRDIGFKRVFQDPSIDPLLRLAPDATDEAAYALYKDSVKISYDPTEGVLGMEVIAPDPHLSQQYSLALIRYAEGQVDQMTARLRDDQMTGAMASYAEAEAKVTEAQRRIQELQQKLGVLDPIAEGTAAMTQISTLETELTQKQLELGQLQANARPNASRVRGVEGDITRLEGMIAERRAALTESSDARSSLASVTGELRIAEGDLLTRQQLLAAAAGQMEAARIEANKQVRYLSMAVAPVPPDTATYPKAVQNTIIAFLIFAGVYLMLSLTASILREQVST